MADKVLRTEKEIVEIYGPKSTRVCYIYLKNWMDAENAAQAVFLN